MQKWIVVSGAVLGLISPIGAARGDDGQAARSQQYHIKCQIAQYDEEGNKKVVATPEVSTMAGREASFFIGGEMWMQNAEGKAEHLEFGQSARLTIRGMTGGKVRVDATVQNSWLEPAPKSKLHLHTNSIRSIEEVRLGEAFRAELDKDPDTGFTYVFELTVQEAETAEK